MSRTSPARTFRPSQLDIVRTAIAPLRSDSGCHRTGPAVFRPRFPDPVTPHTNFEPTCSVRTVSGRIPTAGSRPCERIDFFRPLAYHCAPQGRSGPAVIYSATGSSFMPANLSPAYFDAATVHPDVAENLKTARLWGRNVCDGQMVQRGHLLEDGDVVELRIQCRRPRIRGVGSPAPMRTGGGVIATRRYEAGRKPRDTAQLA